MKRPSETHPAAREERGYSKRLYSLLSALRTIPSSRFTLLLAFLLLLLCLLAPSPLPPPAISLLSRRQDTGTDGRGNHDPLCPFRGLRRGRFQPRIPLTFRIRGIKHFVREIKRDPRRLVNTETGWLFIRFYDNANTYDKISLLFSLTSFWSTLFFISFIYLL